MTQQAKHTKIYRVSRKYIREDYSLIEASSAKEAVDKFDDELIDFDTRVLRSYSTIAKATGKEA